MKPLCEHAAILVFAAILSVPLSAAEAPSNRAAALDQYFSALAQNRQFSGSILVADHGHIIYEKSFGYADRETKRENNAATAFPTASVAKTFTAVAILQLKEQGKLTLDDPAVKYLPQFPYPAITIRQLLAHTSGLPTYGALLDAQREGKPDIVYTNADFLSAIKDTKTPLMFQPGERYSYNNTNYLVLALIIEKLSGSSYLNYVREHVLLPAGMHDTRMVLSFHDYRILQEQTNFAGAYWYPHFWYSDEIVRPDTIPYYARYWNNYNFKGFSDYQTTTYDLLKYDEALYSGKLASETTLREAFTPFQLNNKQPRSSGYGLGWEAEEDSAVGKLVSHSGGMIGFSCVLMRNVTKHQTVVMYANTLPDNYTFIIAKVAFRILNGETVAPPRKSIAREFGKTLVADGFDAAKKVLENLKKDTETYALEEDEFNSLGYDLMGDNNALHIPEQHKYAEAVNVLKLNVEQFPTSANAHDSYAEALQKNGEKQEAIKMYKESLRLNPNNEHAQQALKTLLESAPQ